MCVCVGHDHSAVVVSGRIKNTATSAASISPSHLHKSLYDEVKNQRKQLRHVTKRHKSLQTKEVRDRLESEQEK